jgi:dipeptidyl aminopeptidase/acylaminoacyl peptidase
LLAAEVAALVTLIEEQVGTAQLFELLPAMHEYARFDEVLLTVLETDPGAFKTAWAARLSELTGVATVPEPAVPFYVPIPDQPLKPPPLPSPPTSPGNQIALLCDSQIWVGNLDGSQLIPLTASGERYSSPLWSPDGSWLLTTWRHRASWAASALYLLAANGQEGRLLTDEPDQAAWPVGWSPDGREVIYQRWRSSFRHSSRTETRVMNLETGETHQLPGIPVWSPNGEHLAYLVARSSDVPFGALWLADADWENPRLIAEQALMIWQLGAWSPDGSRLALGLVNADQSGSTIAVYDADTQRLVPLVTPAELTVALELTEDGFLTDGTDPAVLTDTPLRALWPLGWSADGGSLLVWAQGITAHRQDAEPALLAAIPVTDVDEENPSLIESREPEILAFGQGKYLNSAYWSPSDPQRLVFTWLDQQARTEPRQAFILDLSGRSLPFFESDNPVLYANWSPDGAWAAVAEQDRVLIVDPDGAERFALDGPAMCSHAAWNPAADWGGSETKLTPAP